VQTFAKANWPTHYLAMTTITGPSEAWFLTPYDSFEAWERDRQATEKPRACSVYSISLARKPAAPSKKPVAEAQAKKP
jgi:hypothetical protein